MLHLSPLLEVENLRVDLPLDRGVRTLVSGVGLSVGRGEAVALVGESGSGKSLTARAIVQLLPPGLRASGRIAFDGQELSSMSSSEVRAVRGSGIGLLLQDPFTMLNPLRRCGEQIRDGVKGREQMSRAERREDVIRRLAEVGIYDPTVADRFPFQLSGGMRQRVGIAAALAPDPKLLVADEPSTALDVATQGQILRLLGEMKESRGTSVILITHDLRVAFSVCERAYVLYAGEVLEEAGTAAIRKAPLHPYSLGLLKAEPPTDRRLESLTAIPGSVPAPDSVASRCSFAARCQWASDVCEQAHPAFVQAGERGTRCIRSAEIADALSAALGADPGGSELAAENVGSAPRVLSVTGLTKSFRAARRADGRTTAVDDVSIAVGQGEAVGLVGESGSGKTTLSRCSLGLETFDSGSVVIGETDLKADRRLPRTQHRTVSRTAQIIFQDPYTSLNPARSIGATLKEASALTPGSDRASAAELLDLVGLPASYQKRRPVALSGGERQRVAIARALAVKPELILCDEPVSALDVSVQAQILNLLNDLRRKLDLAFLFITHDLGVVRQVASRVYVMKDGRIVEEGSTDQVLDRPTHPYTRALIAAIPAADQDPANE